MKPIQIDKFTGVRNDVTPERMKPGDLTKGLDIELDETGKPQRRMGITSLDATPAHSLWSSEDLCLCVRNNTLYRVMPDMTFVSTGVTILGPKVSYQRVNRDIYITDSRASYFMRDNVWSVWGDTFINENNEEYSPPPAGELLGFYNGRIYIGSGNYLWYTQPYEYQHVNLSANFLGFKNVVKTFNPVSDGIFVGTSDATYFMQGNDPSEFTLKQVAPYGTVLGTESEIPPHMFVGDDKPSEPVSVWMSKKGLCAGLDGGKLLNLTGERYLLPEGVATGASLFKLRGGSPQLVSTLFS